MKKLYLSYVLLRLWGFVIVGLSTAFILLLADHESLSYFSYKLFQNQDKLKTLAILGIFLGLYFMFFSSSKIPDKYLSIKLFKGSMKMHPDMIKESLEKWLNHQNFKDVKLMNVVISPNNKIGLEMKTSDLNQALCALEDIEIKLKDFMATQLGVDGPEVDVQLFEV